MRRSAPARRHRDDGEARALELLRQAVGPRGFRAAVSSHPHYERVWTRDGAIAALAAKVAAADELIAAAMRTLDTVASAVGPHGEIPSNVGPTDGDVSFGGLAGRVDVPLWYAIAVSALAPLDGRFARRHGPVVARALELMSAWELNGRGLVNVPLAGTWADEYLTSGYALEVQALRLYALRVAILADGSVGPDAAREVTAQALRRRIELDYWSDPSSRDDPAHYHPAAYRAIATRRRPYWLAGFDAAGYPTRFDALANILAVGLRLGSGSQMDAVRRTIAARSGGGLVPAFAPVVEPGDAEWRLLRHNHRFALRNRPGAFHNGGRWPWLTGLWVAALAALDREAARRHADAIDRANALGMRGGRDGWAFAEFHDGRTGRPGGVALQTWSAAAAVIARRTLAGATIFPPTP